ncbi:MAG: ImmA/IrrE family metallo-endopeptidase, partial [Spirochaetales bacterium]|nr:ImmA/IrrE family metallo-endopeptidase [Spirochaetales bacterium]
MSTAIIQPDIVKWAIQRSQIEPDQLAHKIPVKPERITEWEEGVSLPTFLQARKLANILHIPFGYLFLQAPPTEEITVPDLRTLRDFRASGFSVDLKDAIADVQRKQDWYRDLLIEDGEEKLPFLNSYNIDSDTKDIARSITETLGLSVSTRNQVRNWEKFLRLLMDRAEEAGIWVMRNGRMGYNSHRVLDVEEFRGFTLCDDYAPVVFLNGADATAAQIFTLIHELAHLWLGESGVSDLSVDPASS